MKKLSYLLLILICANPVFAFKYSEQDKNMFYDAFLDGYITEMQKTVDQLEIEQEKKDKLINEIKKQTKKQDLINSSWACIQSYPIEQIVSASVICTSDWTNKQAEKNKNLFKMLK